MVEKTVHGRTLDRAAVADSLRALADEFETEDRVSVRVGNKAVRLHPPAEVDYEVSVRETSSILRSDRETITVTIDWKVP